MAKILLQMMIILILSGYSLNNDSLSNNQQEQPSIMNQTQNLKVNDLQQPAQDEEWFIGSIGDAKIHAKINILGKEVIGAYYYD